MRPIIGIHKQPFQFGDLCSRPMKLVSGIGRLLMWSVARGRAVEWI